MRDVFFSFNCAVSCPVFTRTASNSLCNFCASASALPFAICASCCLDRVSWSAILSSSVFAFATFSSNFARSRSVFSNVRASAAAFCCVSSSPWIRFFSVSAIPICAISVSMRVCCSDRFSPELMSVVSFSFNCEDSCSVCTQAAFNSFWSFCARTSALSVAICASCCRVRVSWSAILSSSAFSLAAFSSNCVCSRSVFSAAIASATDFCCTRSSSWPRLFSASAIFSCASNCSALVLVLASSPASCSRRSFAAFHSFFNNWERDSVCLCELRKLCMVSSYISEALSMALNIS